MPFSNLRGALSGMRGGLVGMPGPGAGLIGRNGDKNGPIGFGAFGGGFSENRARKRQQEFAKRRIDIFDNTKSRDQLARELRLDRIKRQTKLSKKDKNARGEDFTCMELIYEVCHRFYESPRELLYVLLLSSPVLFFVLPVIHFVSINADYVASPFHDISDRFFSSCSGTWNYLLSTSIGSWFASSFIGKYIISGVYGAIKSMVVGVCSILFYLFFTFPSTILMGAVGCSFGVGKKVFTTLVTVVSFPFYFLYSIYNMFASLFVGPATTSSGSLGSATTSSGLPISSSVPPRSTSSSSTTVSLTTVSGSNQAKDGPMVSAWVIKVFGMVSGWVGDIKNVVSNIQYSNEKSSANIATHNSAKHNTKSAKHKRTKSKAAKSKSLPYCYDDPSKKFMTSEQLARQNTCQQKVDRNTNTNHQQTSSKKTSSKTTASVGGVNNVNQQNVQQTIEVGGSEGHSADSQRRIDSQQPGEHDEPSVRVRKEESASTVVDNGIDQQYASQIARNIKHYVSTMEWYAPRTEQHASRGELENEAAHKYDTHRTPHTEERRRDRVETSVNIENGSIPKPGESNSLPGDGNNFNEPERLKSSDRYTRDETENTYAPRPSYYRYDMFDDPAYDRFLEDLKRKNTKNYAGKIYRHDISFQEILERLEANQSLIWAYIYKIRYIMKENLLALFIGWGSEVHVRLEASEFQAS